MINRKGNAGKNNVNENSYLKVYPNPATDFISVEYKLNDEIAGPVIKIVSATGQLVKYRELANS